MTNTMKKAFKIEGIVFMAAGALIAGLSAVKKNKPAFVWANITSILGGILLGLSRGIKT